MRMRKLAPFLLLILFFISPGVVFASNSLWLPYKNVSSSEVSSSRPDSVVDANNCLHVVWEQEDGIYHRYLCSGIWSDAIRLSTEGVHSHSPQICTGSDRLVYAFWTEVSDNGNYLYTASWSGGWDNPIAVVDKVVQEGKIACGNSVYFAWTESKKRNLYVSSGFDSTADLIAEDVKGGFSIGAFGSTAVVAYLGKEGSEHYAAVRVKGEGWGNEQRINFGSSPRFVEHPHVFMSSAGTFLGVQVDTEGGAVTRVYQSTGSGWELYAEQATGLCFYDFCIDADGVLHLLYEVWPAYRGANIRYQSLGRDWSSYTNISRSRYYNSSHPSLGLTDFGVKYAVWQEASGGWGDYSQIVFSKTFDYRPVLFIPGIADNASNWRLGNKSAYVQELMDLGYPEEMIRVFGDKVNYNIYNDLSFTAGALRNAVIELSDQYKDWGGDGKINVVGYSLGGVIAREYMKQFADDHRVAKLVTIATPHKGVWPLTGDNFFILLDDYGIDFGDDLRQEMDSELSELYSMLGFEGINFGSTAMQQLRPGSPYLAELNSRVDEDVEYAAVYGDIGLAVSAHLFFYRVFNVVGSLGDGLVLANSAVGVPVAGLEKYEYLDEPFIELAFMTDRVENAIQLSIELLTPHEFFKYNHLNLPKNSQVSDKVIDLLMER